MSESVCNNLDDSFRNETILHLGDIPTLNEQIVNVDFSKFKSCKHSSGSTKVFLCWDEFGEQLIFRDFNFQSIFGYGLNVSVCLKDLFGSNTDNESITIIKSHIQLSKYLFNYIFKVCYL